MSVSYTYLGLGWVAFYALHSFLATLLVKKWIEKRLPSIHKFYRLWYNLIAFITLALLLAYHASLPSPELFASNFFVKLVAAFLLFGGSIIAGIAFKNYNTAEFLGLKTENSATAQLATSGLNRFVRHPLYLGIIVIYFIEKYLCGWTTTASTPLQTFGATF